MRILLAFESFDAYGGTETYTLTVSQELERLGHDAPIVTREPGAMAEHAREQGARVLGPDELPETCDAVLAQDAASAYDMAARYPAAVHAQVCHSRDYALQYPPAQSGVCDAVVVLNDRVGRWVQASGSHPPVTRLRQPIDLLRFADLGPARRPAERVLVSSNYVSGPRAALIDEACAAAGLEVAWLGTTSEPSATPDTALAEADIVIGLGRSALEAMAAGRATYVYGVLGSGGWVTPESYARLEADGFAGDDPGAALDAAALARELERWSPALPEAGRDLASRHSSADHAIELVDLVRELARSSGRRPPRPAPDVAADHARLVRLEWQATRRGMMAKLEADRLRERLALCDDVRADALARVAELDSHLADARGRIAELEALVARLAEAGRLESERLAAQRRHRVVSTLLSPLDRLRARRAQRREPDTG